MNKIVDNYVQLADIHGYCFYGFPLLQFIEFFPILSLFGLFLSLHQIEIVHILIDIRSDVLYCSAHFVFYKLLFAVLRINPNFDYFVLVSFCFRIAVTILIIYMTAVVNLFTLRITFRQRFRSCLHIIDDQFFGFLRWLLF